MSRVITALLRSAPVVTSAAILAATATPAEASTPPAVVEPITQPDTRFLGVSPDGHLVAALEEGDDPLVCALDVTTLDEVACDELPAVRLDDRSVRWSPDSTAFAFTEPSFIDLTDGDLWVFDITGGRVRDLTDDGYSGPLTDADDSIAIDVLPAWSPDSSTIAFSRSSIADGARGTAIVRVPASGGPATTIAEVSDVPGAVYLGLVWPKADTIIYSRSERDPDDPANGVYRLGTADGSTEQLVGVDPELGPPVIQDVTPDGATGLILYWIAAQQRGFANLDAYAIADLRGSSHDSTPVDAVTDEGIVMSATLAPDGVALATVESGPDLPTRLVTRPLDGGTSTSVAELDPAHAAVVATGADSFTWTTDSTLTAVTFSGDAFFVAPVTGWIADDAGSAPSDG